MNQRANPHFLKVMIGTAVFGLFIIAASVSDVAGEEAVDRVIVCHRGIEIEIGDPAVLAAHELHGDCVGTCFDCEGTCCLPDGMSLQLTQQDCTTSGGRFQWEKDADCTFGAVD